MSIDIEAEDTGAILAFSADPQREGFVEVIIEGKRRVRKVGSFKIRDLLIILHATAGASHQAEQTRSKPPIWMREN